MALIFTLTGDSDESSISVYTPESGLLSALSSHPNFHAIVEGARAGDESVVELFDVATGLSKRLDSVSERVSVADDKVYLDGDELHGAIVEHIMDGLRMGLRDFTPEILFLENLSNNPNPGSVEQFYAWLERESFTIDQDGMIVAYKGVAPDGDGGFRSIKAGRARVNGVEVSGTIPQNIGDVVEMPRSEVKDDSAVGCATGLHVGNFDYANGWAQGALLEVRVNPRDVVSVPHDCSAQKVRVCRYTVVGTIEQKIEAPVYADADLYDSLYFGDVWGDGEYDDLDYDLDW